VSFTALSTRLLTIPVLHGNMPNPNKYPMKIYETSIAFKYIENGL